MSVVEDRLPWLETLRLEKGSHSPDGAACVMEAVSYVAGEPWSDHPKCASPIITTFLVRLNDRLNDENRQILKPYIPRLVGTNTGRQEDEDTRRWMIADWLVHEALPGVLAEAAADAVADAAADAVDAWGPTYDAAYKAAYDILKPAYEKALEPISAGLRQSALLLLDRMIEVGR